MAVRAVVVKVAARAVVARAVATAAEKELG